MTIEALLPDVSRTAFGELQIAEFTPVTGWSFAYNVNANMVKSTVVGGAVGVEAGHAILTTNAINQSAKIETVRPLRYTPGIGGVARFTAIFTPGQVGSTQIIGLGDSRDGMFFGYNGVDFGINRRRGGEDNWTYIDQWSERDRSFADDWLDTSFGNVFQIIYQWLGYGMQFYFLEETESGKLDLVHKISYANKNTQVSLLNPTLPLIAEVKNTTNSTAIVLKTPSAIAGVHGKLFGPIPIHPFSFYRTLKASKTGVTTETNILTIRNEAIYQGLTNRVHCRITALSIHGEGAGNNSVTIQGKLNATLGGSPSYANYNTNTSPMSYDTAGTTVTGGTLRFSFEIGRNMGEIVDLEKFGLELAPGDTFTISVTSASAIAPDLGLTWVDQF